MRAIHTHAGYCWNMDALVCHLKNEEHQGVKVSFHAFFAFDPQIAGLVLFVHRTKRWPSRPHCWLSFKGVGGSFPPKRTQRTQRTNRDV